MDRLREVLADMVAESLGVPVTQLTRPNNIIPEIKDFFRDGILPPSAPSTPEQPSPNFVRSGVVEFGNGIQFALFAAKSTNHPFLRTVQEWQTYFRSVEPDEQVDVWEDLTPEAPAPEHYSFNWQFSSAMSARRNLEELQQDQQPMDFQTTNPGEPSLEDYMNQARQS